MALQYLAASAWGQQLLIKLTRLATTPFIIDRAVTWAPSSLFAVLSVLLVKPTSSLLLGIVWLLKTLFERMFLVFLLGLEYGWLVLVRILVSTFLLPRRFLSNGIFPPGFFLAVRWRSIFTEWTVAPWLTSFLTHRFICLLHLRMRLCLLVVKWLLWSLCLQQLLLFNMTMRLVRTAARCLWLIRSSLFIWCGQILWLSFLNFVLQLRLPQNPCYEASQLAI